MSARRCSLVAAAAGGFLAVTVPVAHADGDSSDALGLAGAIDPSFVTSMTDPGFISSTENFGRFTDIAAANPDDSHFVANVFEGPLIHGTPLFEDILTSGADPGNGLRSEE